MYNNKTDLVIHLANGNIASGNGNPLNTNPFQVKCLALDSRIIIFSG